MHVSISNQNELREFLKEMRPGMVLSGLTFKLIDEKKNQIELKDTTILCRERHSTKNSGKAKQSGYRYEVFNNKHLGKGGFGKVFLIMATLKLTEHHEIEILKKENNKTRVVKVDCPKKSNLCAENEALFGVTIPYLHMKPDIKGVESSKQEKLHYIVMHKMPGATLDELLENGSIRKLNENRKILLLLSLLEALQNLHQRGLVHGDIKPDNIMLKFEPENLNPQVYIIDFGFCNWEGNQDNKILGNSHYIAPELFDRDKKSCHSSSDIYSLGKTFADIYDDGLIRDPEIEALIQKMTLSDYEKRISLKKAIDELKRIYLMQESVRLKLSLLLSLSFNRNFASILKKFSLSKQILINLTQSIKNFTEIKDLDEKLDLVGILNSFGNSYNSQLGKILIDAVKLSIDAQVVNNKLNDLRQSIVKAIFTYVQKTYSVHSNDRAGSERRINNIQALLVILKDFRDEEALKNSIVTWNKTIERGCLGNSKLYDLVSEAAGLKRKNTIQSLFWPKSANVHPIQQRLILTV